MSNTTATRFNHADCDHASTRLARRDCRLSHTEVRVTIPAHGLFVTTALELRATRAALQGEGITSIQDRIYELTSIDYTDVDDRFTLTAVMSELMWTVDAA